MAEVDTLEHRRLLACAVIQGYVYVDRNNDGIRVPGDPPIPNVLLTLRDAADNIVATTTTGPDGSYVFDHDPRIDIRPRTLAQTLNFPVGGDPTTPWTSSGTLPQFDPALGTLTSVEILGAVSVHSTITVENLEDVDQTFIETFGATVTLAGAGGVDLVFSPSESRTIAVGPGESDTNEVNLGQDAPPMTLTDPAQLALFTGAGTVAYSASAVSTSSVDGPGNFDREILTNATAQIQIIYHYTPSNCLAPGRYTVNETQPAGYLDGLDAAEGVVIPGSVGTDTIPVLLGTADSLNNNFGELLPASISGNKYLVANHNGVRDPDEFGIAHVAITLTGTDDTGRTVRLTTMTDANGRYSFNDLRPGVYILTETPPPFFRPALSAMGTLGGIRQGMGNQITTIRLQQGKYGVNYDFAEAARPGCKLYCFGAHARRGTPTTAVPGPLIRYYLPTMAARLDAARPMFRPMLRPRIWA